MSATKPFTISKHLVMQAFLRVKDNAGAAGIDKQSIEDFEKNLQDNLYKIWNRMSSGTYFPPPVKAVPIPKKNGGQRILGIPTVGDRVAQMVVKLTFEPLVEPYFLSDSYGYRPGRSALDAVAITRKRCWQHDYVVEFDIKGLFDNIDHALVMRAVRWHTDVAWVILYIERWLTAPMQGPDGTLTERIKGTPQGGVVSPVLANLFLHYVFDVWMSKQHPTVPWCRYADDALLHCRTEQQAQILLNALSARMRECGLELHPIKTKIVYCKDQRRKERYPQEKFDFLGYTFRPRMVKNRKSGALFLSFSPAVSAASLNSMRGKMRQWNIRNRSDLSLEEIAQRCNPVLLGWMNYYGRFHQSALYPMYRHFNMTMVAWAKHKYKRLARNKRRASEWMKNISKRSPHLFVHWTQGTGGAFA